MKIVKTCSVATSVILLTSCGTSGREVEKKSNGEYQPDHGPFDSQGNYIESWADNPPKRTYRKSSPRSHTKKSTTPSRKKVTTKSKTSTKPKTNSKPKTSYKPKTSSKPKASPKPAPKPKKITPRAKPPVMHTVKKRDTVYGIARKYGADPHAIIKVNGIKNGVIRVGQRLVVPRK